jgi:hypothetical protein
MKRYRNNLALIRAFIVVAAVTAMVSGVTFAGLQSQQSKLTGNTIQTATANLLVSSDGTNYSNSQNGFVFANLVPGGQAMPLNGYNFYLKNAGGTPLSLKLAVSSPPANPDNADLTKVNVIISPIGGGSPQSFTLAALVAAGSSGGLAINTPSNLSPGFSSHYTLQVSMASDAVTGPGATISNVDFSFTGVAGN